MRLFSSPAFASHSPFIRAGNPTDVECFDMAQSNSEHSRHWFFGGKMIVDGKEMESTLFKRVKSTVSTTPDDSTDSRVERLV